MEKENCKDHYVNCPIQQPFSLLEQRLVLSLEEIQKDIKRILNTIYGDGNGNKGVNIRVVELEIELKQIVIDIADLRLQIKQIAEKSETLKWQVIKALFWLASGAGGTAGLIKILGA